VRRKVFALLRGKHTVTISVDASLRIGGVNMKYIGEDDWSRVCRGTE